ncbi:MAG: hypothetical protein NVS3B10_30920 [Polyangiales bacterium]
MNATVDNANCGGCGLACGGGARCVGGACACPSGKTACAGGCVDTKTSPNDCGTCGTACGAGQSCVAGSCVGGKPDGGVDAPGTDGGADGGGGSPDASFDAQGPEGAPSDPDFQGSCGCRVVGPASTSEPLAALSAMAVLAGCIAVSRRRRSR